MIEGAPISLSSTKQNILALSSCETEYVAASYASCQTTQIDMLL